MGSNKKIVARWHEREFFLAGQPLTLKLKALSHEEAPEFLKKMLDFANDAKAARAEGAVSDPFMSLEPAFARACFEKWVRPGEEMADDEGHDIVTGADVYGLVNAGLTLSVLTALQEYAILTEREGKAFSSPSTSGVAPGTTLESGASPATSTGGEDGLAG